jgi:hypothetical protein
VRFVEFLRVTVLLSAGAGTTLAVLTLAAAAREQDNTLVFLAMGWWVVALLLGSWLGRRTEIHRPIARLIADAKAATIMPELRPGTTMANRLWPLLLGVVLAGGLGFVFGQIPAIAVGFTIIWSLYWRRQGAAVAAVEERDGVTFYVEPTSPVRPIQLIRIPGFRRERPTVNGTGV